MAREVNGLEPMYMLLVAGGGAPPSAALKGVTCRRRRRKNQVARPAMAASPTTPPTAPPTIAPVLVDFEEGWDEDVVEELGAAVREAATLVVVETLVAVAGAVVAVDSGLSPTA